MLLEPRRFRILAEHGENNKIKTMQRQAYGFRDYEFFKLKKLTIHQAKLKLVG